MNLNEIILIMVLGITFGIVYVLLTRVKQKYSNLFLALCFLVIALHLIFAICYERQWFSNYHSQLFLPIYWSSSIGVFLFLYQGYYTKGRRKLNRTDLIHFAPWILLVCYPLYWWSEPLEIRYSYFKEEYPFNSFLIEQGLPWLVSFSYSLVALVSLKQEHRRIYNLLTKDAQKVFRWSLRLLSLNLFIHFGWGLFIIASVVGSTYLDLFLPQYLLELVISGFVVWMVGSLAQNPLAIFTNVDLSKASTKSRLLERRLDELSTPRVFDLLRGPFSLEELAELLEVEKSFLSSYFRIHFGQNYPGYVRQIRMKKFQSLVAEHKKKHTPIQIKKLQMECGYRNRGSFNRDVKEVFDLSPTEYIDKIENGSMAGVNRKSRFIELFFQRKELRPDFLISQDKKYSFDHQSPNSIAE